MTLEISDNLAFSDTSNIYSDGTFALSKDKSILTLSDSLSQLLNVDLGEFQSSLPKNFFMEEAHSRSVFLRKELSFMNKKNQETIVSFRYKSTEDNESIKGDVFIIRNESVIDPISSVYHNLSLRALSSSFAHEINNPLAIISSVSDWMSIRLAKSDVDVPSFKDKLLVVKSSISRIQTLIGGIETSVKGFSFDSDVFLIHVAIDKTYKIFSKRITNHQIDVEIDVEKNINVLGDPVLISQILFNVFSTVVGLAGNQGIKKIAIKSRVEESAVSISFLVQGKYQNEGDLFLQDINSEVINHMLTSQSGGFVKKITGETVEFQLTLKRRV